MSEKRAPLSSVARVAQWTSTLDGAPNIICIFYPNEENAELWNMSFFICEEPEEADRILELVRAEPREENGKFVHPVLEVDLGTGRGPSGTLLELIQDCRKKQANDPLLLYPPPAPGLPFIILAPFTAQDPSLQRGYYTMVAATDRQQADALLEYTTYLRSGRLPH